MNGPSTNWGHPVAYHPMLSHFFGSVNAAIFFCQLRYWGDRTVNPLGVYKTSEEWTTETGLSYREQATARRILSDPGFVIETNKRLEHRIYFLIDWSAFNPAFEAWLDKKPPAPITRTPNCAKRISPNDENAIGGDRKRRSSISTETTAETTADIPAAAPTAPPPGASLVVPAKPKKAKAEPAGETELQAACRSTWAAYASAYTARYGAAPVRNAKVNSAVKAFVMRLGHDESPAVAAFFVERVSEAAVVRSTHDFGLLLNRCESYRTQWATGRTAAPANTETAYQRSMRERVAEVAPAIARKAPGTPPMQAVEFFNTVKPAPALRIESNK